MSFHCIVWYCIVLYCIRVFCTVLHCHVPLLQRAGELLRSASSHFNIIIYSLPTFLINMSYIIGMGVLWSIHSIFLNLGKLRTEDNSIYTTLEVKEPSGPRLLAGGPSGFLTSSLAPFGRLGPRRRLSENPQVFRKYRSQAVGNTAKHFGEIMLTTGRWERDQVYCDKDRGGGGTAYSSNWIHLPLLNIIFGGKCKTYKK